MNACVHTYTKPRTSSTLSRGLGRRIHGSVEDTKLSTNKQQSLSKQQQALMRTRSQLEAALREATAKNGLTMLQLTCMHDLGITASVNLSLQDKELLVDTLQGKYS